MANRRQDLETRVVATDDASKVFDKVAKKADELEGREVEIPVGVKDETTDQVQSITAKLDALSDEDKAIVLQAKADDAQRDIDRILRSLRDVESMDDQQIQMRVDALGEARADLERVEAELKQIDQMSVEPKIDTGRARSEFDKMGKSADSSGSVIANMAGNITQDLGQIGGVAGSAGVAIGQMGEYMTDAALAGEGLGSVLTNFGTAAVPIAALAVALKLINDRIAEAKKVAEFDTKNLDAFVEALADGVITAEEFNTIIADTAKGSERIKFINMRNQFQDLEGALLDVGDALPGTGSIVERFFKLINKGQPAVLKWAKAQEDAGANTESTGAIVFAAAQYTKDLASAQNTSAADAKLFGTAQQDAGDKAATATPKILGNADAVARYGIALSRLQPLADKRKEDAAAIALDASRQAAILLNKADIAAHNEEVVQQVKDLATGILAYNQAVDAMDEGTIAVEGAVSAWQELTSQRFGLDTIFSNVEEAWDNLADTMRDDNGKIRMSWDLTTEKGRAINQALQEVASTMTARVASAFDAADGSWRKFRQSMQDMRQDTIKRLMDDLHVSADDAAALADKLVGTSKDWKATFELSGTEEAMTKIGLLQGAIDNLPEDINIKVTNQIINGDYKGALQTIQDYYDDQNLQVKVNVVLGEIPKFFSSGLGLGVGFGGASATPTVSRYATPATATATATVPVAVTPAASVQPTVNHFHQNFAGAIMGDPFAIAQTIDDANKRSARLMPKNA